jgi:hypothetical protein
MWLMAIWSLLFMMLVGQCAGRDDIKDELRDIKYEIHKLKYK